MVSPHLDASYFCVCKCVYFGYQITAKPLELSMAVILGSCRADHS